MYGVTEDHNITFLPSRDYKLLYKDHKFLLSILDINLGVTDKNSNMITNPLTMFITGYIKEDRDSNTKSPCHLIFFFATKT